MKDGRIWLTKNLNLKTANSYCFQDIEDNCKTDGRLYTWDAALEACKALGEGWRLPTDKEWEALALAYGGLKEWEGNKEYTTTKDPAEAFNNLIKGGSSGFDALLVGTRDRNGKYGNIYYRGKLGCYWASTNYGSNGARRYLFNGSKNELIRTADESKASAYSCRCIKD
mgnify:CR=1 FL=1